MRVWRKLDGGGRVGAALVLFVLAVAFLGPLAAPYSPTKPVGLPGSGPSLHDLLGTDFIGRDVLSRVLYGGRSVILLGAAATVLSYVIGGLVGLIAGYTRSFADSLLMRGVDVLRAFPPLLVLLVLATGAGNGVPILVFGVGLVEFPPLSRIFRTATLEASQASYVDAAVLRGERTRAILWREILPNIADQVTATIGLYFSLSIILIASMNFIGLGLQPPTADWGLMVAENRGIINLNPWVIIVPTLMIAVLTVGLTLVGDSYAGVRGRSTVKTQPGRRRGLA